MSEINEGSSVTIPCVGDKVNARMIQLASNWLTYTLSVQYKNLTQIQISLTPMLDFIIPDFMVIIC